jgi:hypothetical protein
MPINPTGMKTWKEYVNDVSWNTKIYFDVPPVWLRRNGLGGYLAVWLVAYIKNSTLVHQYCPSTAQY